MSIEADFRAQLAGYAPLTALVSTRIALNALLDSAGMPCVVFGLVITPIIDAGLVKLAERAAITVQCWGETAASAQAVADSAVAAVAAAPISHAAQLVDRSTAYDEELGLDGVLLTFDWWD